MNSKAKNKRAKLPFEMYLAKTFQKDWERLNRSGRYDMNALKRVMLLLVANDEPLPAEYLDHPLTGDYTDFKECHIGGDFLLIYTVDTKQNKIVFTRIGTHSELF
ncbi:type II toxin-antitoxin system YafQ family toxin [Exercitatus varius]|uniref:type II toxin-antitoxin system YafQ family toxin n=1 Tax=Exercitatus varius TaxID=67857 RepID=UPI00294B4982|nr:type II toxin-antitoxin system YafQ family toxin [Exercitatus varius]MDG2961691.1 type II toxin-antitoxin system YafQ family toxin [Exercitatus varius]